MAAEFGPGDVFTGFDGLVYVYDSDETWANIDRHHGTLFLVCKVCDIDPIFFNSDRLSVPLASWCCLTPQKRLVVASELRLNHAQRHSCRDENAREISTRKPKASARNATRVQTRWQQP